ncbi:hypothetical protein ACFV9C_27185 [Kribbella sp. NPDC059898]|uniref:hypothetical protein n=1 Tax=Kribbella sp. NPDC059898 TaxID=3346995 RepID=UPI0036540ECE
MTYLPIDEQITGEAPVIIDKVRSYWYARGFVAGNPPLGGLLLSYLDEEFPPEADAADGEVAADVMAMMFADAFECCPHGDIELAFVQWMTRALLQDSPVLPNPPQQ